MTIKKILPYATTALLTLVAIYLTPLKWVTVIEPTIKDIDPVAFQSDFVKNSDRYIFIDVRSETAYNKVHAVGSINMPLHTLYDQRHVLPKNGKEIILICSGGRASGVAYSYLQHYGFFNIKRIDGGIENWIAEGLPVDGSAPTEKPLALADPSILYCV
ncbi:hypothetical protein A2935_04115 [Candidatus Wolfebacteria bacterium RIFCSPLOWO2_01_FULL_47_17b]|uniref:Rhodanese domain-containing protein n=1 Tax=Candidatus Wolfebacteria bacterium RIFCSPLOWO2_01_FULL_47_17b TaxID=1802558 RepID=A0A1F8DZ32_9BACT|nr:MAG: hypothetical protein A2935_04115 [Candidatus Wolfebacteria bacterium RIFCSPLOWO2_01_FULL_47_17b]